MTRLESVISFIIWFENFAKRKGTQSESLSLLTSLYIPLNSNTKIPKNITNKIFFQCFLKNSVTIFIAYISFQYRDCIYRAKRKPRVSSGSSSFSNEFHNPYYNEHTYNHIAKYNDECRTSNTNCNYGNRHQYC